MGNKAKQPHQHVVELMLLCHFVPQWLHCKSHCCTTKTVKLTIEMEIACFSDSFE